MHITCIHLGWVLLICPLCPFSPDVTVHVAQGRHEFKRLGELHNLQKKTQVSAMTTFSNKESFAEEKLLVLIGKWRKMNLWGKKRTNIKNWEEPHRWVNVVEEEHRAAFTLQQGQRSLHDLPDNLLQVGLLFKQVIDHLQQSLWQGEC